MPPSHHRRRRRRRAATCARLELRPYRPPRHCAVSAIDASRLAVHAISFRWILSPLQDRRCVSSSRVQYLRARRTAFWKIYFSRIYIIQFHFSRREYILYCFLLYVFLKIPRPFCEHFFFFTVRVRRREAAGASLLYIYIEKGWCDDAAVEPRASVHNRLPLITLQRVRARVHSSTVKWVCIYKLLYIGPNWLSTVLKKKIKNLHTWTSMYTWRPPHRICKLRKLREVSCARDRAAFASQINFRWYTRDSYME